MRLLTCKEVAQELAVSHWTIKRLIHDGALPAVVIRAGKRTTYRVRAELLAKWVANRERKVISRTPQRRTDTKRPAKFDDVLTGDADRSQVPEVSARAHAGLSSDEPSGEVV